MMNSIGFSSASRRRNFLPVRAGEGPGTSVGRSTATDDCAGEIVVEALAFIGIASVLYLLQRDETFLLDDLLALRSQAPFDVGFDFLRRIASGVHIELAGDRIFAVAGDFNSRCDGFAAFLRGNLEPIHLVG